MTTYRLFKENTAELTGDSLVDNLLSVRGITTKEDADIFLNPSYERDIKDPFGIFGMKEAVERITKALFTNEKIVIYSDYDCDGVPGGVVLRDFLDAIGYKNYSVYIPHRIEEGYGIHKHALDELSEQGAKLMITVDLAITNIEEVAYAKEKGIDVIVTDHHLPIHNLSEGEEYKGEGKISGQYIVPNAVSVINSKQDLCTYHDDMLCGSGVIWKVVCATLSHLRTQKKVSTKQSKKEITRNDVLDAVEKLPLGWEIGRAIERKEDGGFGVKISRDPRSGKNRFGVHCDWMDYRLNKTTYNMEGIKAMKQYIREQRKSKNK
jgi:single-stranded-DNA-specific exonuclease